MELEDVESLVFGFELWTPARIAQPRLVIGHEARVRGALFALKSQVYSPGPFDTLRDVQSVVLLHLDTVVAELLEGKAP